MSNTELRRIFDQVIGQQTDAGKVADLEICREYFTNPKFKTWLEDTTAQINGIAG